MIECLDWVDSSGIKVHLTSTLRRYDAAVLELGLEYIDKMAIPPREPHFSLSGYCVSECTGVVSTNTESLCADK